MLYRRDGDQFRVTLTHYVLLPGTATTVHTEYISQGHWRRLSMIPRSSSSRMPSPQHRNAFAGIALSYVLRRV